jgi:Predicted transcriptional regulators
MTFGERLRELRNEKGVTQKDLSKVICVSDRVIGYYEANNRFPKDVDILIKLSDYFNVSVDFLIGRSILRSLRSEYAGESSYSLDVNGLSAEAIKMAEEYIELLRLKYDSN